MAILIQMTDGSAGIKLRIDKPVFRIGRGPENEISINDDLVSKLHAVIEAVENPEAQGIFEYYIQDQDSTNGTFVNDQKISFSKLANADYIRIGMNNFRFVDDANDDLAETAKLHKSWIPGVYYTKKKGKKARKKKSSKPK